MITTIADASQVAEARRLVSGHARRTGMSEARVAQVAVVVTELATNLLKHAGGGQILAQRCDDGEGVGLEVLALDRGRGMADVDRCMADGYSTAGSPGNGLGAVIRLADDVRIYSRTNVGSAIMVRFLHDTVGGGAVSGVGNLTRGGDQFHHLTDKPGGSGLGSDPGSRFGPRTARGERRSLLGAAAAPYPGESVCGDQWSFCETSFGRTLAVADGAGHGIEAARAASLAVQVFQDHADASCEEIVERMHRALAPTRGAAVSVARIDDAAKTVRYVGVGNIVGALVSRDGTRHMVSHNGTAGHVAPRIREFTYDFSGDPLVIMHSDGLTGRWDLAAYPGLAAQHPSLIAGVLLRDYRRARDDATVVAMRPFTPGPSALAIAGRTA